MLATSGAGGLYLVWPHCQTAPGTSSSLRLRTAGHFWTGFLCFAMLTQLRAPLHREGSWAEAAEVSNRVRHRGSCLSACQRKLFQGSLQTHRKWWQVTGPSFELSQLENMQDTPAQNAWWLRKCQCCANAASTGAAVSASGLHFQNQFLMTGAPQATDISAIQASCWKHSMQLLVWSLRGGASQLRAMTTSNDCPN